MFDKNRCCNNRYHSQAVEVTHMQLATYVAVTDYCGDINSVKPGQSSYSNDYLSQVCNSYCHLTGH